MLPVLSPAKGKTTANILEYFSPNHFSLHTDTYILGWFSSNPPKQKIFQNLKGTFLSHLKICFTYIGVTF